MKKNIMPLTILLCFALQSTTTWSAINSMHQISLSYRKKTLLGNNPRPTKAPSYDNIPLHVILDEENQLLLFKPLSAGIYTYYIYTESNEIITQGVISYSKNNSIYLGDFPCGSYTLVVTYNGIIGEGKFEV